MSLNGNRFKLSDRSKPCPTCLGYPPLKLFEGRLRPECETCDGLGSVPREESDKPTRRAVRVLKVPRAAARAAPNRPA